MTETEWLAATDPAPMLEFLKGKVSDRKLRLFVIACCRRINARLYNQPSQTAIEIAEHYLEGKATLDDLIAAHSAADGFYGTTGIYGTDDSDLPARAAALASVPNCFGIIALYRRSFRFLRPAEQASNAAILRDIAPFRPITHDPAWLTSTVTSLARQMYDSRGFSAMPILADALQDAGCDNEDILNHCRTGSVHVRGCWLVDLVLGRL